MKHARRAMFAMLMVLLCNLFGQAQQSAATATNAMVPPLIQFSNVATDESGDSQSGVVSITFALYSNQQGGEPLWTEKQSNVQLDATGHYSVQLGITKRNGVPTTLFVSGEARWLGVQIAEQSEQPRVLLLSVPYALKAGDAATIGGLPPSAFVLAASATSGTSTFVTTPAETPTGTDVTGSGTSDFLPLWTTTSNIGNSIVFQSGTGSTAKIGLNTITPAATLDANGKTDIRDTLTLFPKTTDNTLSVSGTSFNISSIGKVTFISGQTFPGAGTITGITTAAGSGLAGGGTTGMLSLRVPSAGITNAMLENSKMALNASAAGGLTVPGEVTLGDAYTIGLKICGANQVLQYVGTAWTCSNAGTGTITEVTAGTALTGGGTGGKVTLNVDVTKIPQLSAANIFKANQTVDGTVTATSFAGSGSGLTNVTAANSNELGGLASSAFAQLAANNTFKGVQTINNTTIISGGGDFGVLQVSSSAGAANIPAIIGTALNSGIGVEGLGATVGVVGTGSGAGGFGMQGTSSNVGIYGQAAGASREGANFGSIGVWGDAGGLAGDYVAVMGSADENFAGQFFNNGSDYTTLYAENDAESSFDAVVFATNGPHFGGFCAIDVSGDLECSGSTETVTPVDGGSRNVALYAIEGPENWLEDAGSGQLSNGAAAVSIEPVFGQTVNTEMDYHVFLTPKGDCEGLYVSNETPGGFDVHELRGGRGNVAFDYRIMAKRKGYDSLRLADKTSQFGKEAMERNKKRRPIRPTSTPQAMPRTQMHPLSAAARPLYR